MSDDTVITLSRFELAMARAVAAELHDQATEMSLKPRWGQPNDPERLRRDNSMGARGELALAKYLGMYWGPQPFAERHNGDVGSFEVRTTRTGFLILHHSDPDDRVFVAVKEITESKLRIVGWCRAMHGKMQHYWNTDLPRPAFAVPFDDLSLPEMLRVLV